MPKINWRFRKAAKYRPESETVWIRRPTRERRARLYGMGMALVRRELVPEQFRSFLHDAVVFVCWDACDDPPGGSDIA